MPDQAPDGATPETPSEPVRVLHVVKGLNAGGAETLLVLAARFRDRNRFTDEVAYLLPDHTALRETLEEEGPSTICLDAASWWDPRWLIRLRKRLQTHPVAVIHAHAPLLASGARLVRATLAPSRRPVMVVTLHNMWDSHHPAVRAVDRLTHRADDQRITVSDAVRRSLPGGSGKHAVTVVHGVDVDRLRDAADRAAARRDMGVQDDEIVVGTVANLRGNKAYPDLIQAAEQVVRTHPEVRFVAIGQGPLQSALEAQRDAAGLEGQLRFLGHRADAARLVSGFDIFCLPSRVEGLPLALMEALVLGVPVVVTDVGGVGELVTDGCEGAVVPAGRPDALAQAIGSLVADPALRRSRGEAAARRGDRLDAAGAAVKIEDHYDRVLRDAAEPAVEPGGSSRAE